MHATDMADRQRHAEKAHTHTHTYARSKRSARARAELVCSTATSSKRTSLSRMGAPSLPSPLLFDWKGEEESGRGRRRAPQFFFGGQAGQGRGGGGGGGGQSQGFSSVLSVVRARLCVSIERGIRKQGDAIKKNRGASKR